MSVILGGIVGVLIGISLFAVVSATEINKMQDESYEYKKKYLAEKFKVQQRDILIRDYQKDQVILLENAKEDRAKIKNLENNLSVLQQSIPQIKELVDDDQSNN